jgi:hypothetical protein
MNRFIFVIVVLALIGGCNTPAEQMGFGTVKQQTTKNLSSGQVVEVVNYTELSNWLDKHKDIKIDAMTWVKNDSSDATTSRAFVIVYSPLK